MPVGEGLWPGFWMTGSNIATVGALLDGEIDIAEAHGQNPTMSSGACHRRRCRRGERAQRGRLFPVPNEGNIDGWHNYSVTWSPYGIMWQIDGITVHTMSPGQAQSYWSTRFEHPFTMLLDLTIGGVGTLPDPATMTPVKMLVDSVTATTL